MTYSITVLCGNGITAAKKARKMRLSAKKHTHSPYVKGDIKGVFGLYVDWQDDKYHHFLQGIKVVPEDCGDYNYLQKVAYFLDNEYYLYFCGEVDNQLVWEYTEHDQYEEAKTLNLLKSWADANEETDKVIRCIKYFRGTSRIFSNTYNVLNPLIPIRLI